MLGQWVGPFSGTKLMTAIFTLASKTSSSLQDAFTHACMLPASNPSLPLKQSFLGRSSFQNSTEIGSKKKKGWGGESHLVAPLKSCVNLGKLFISLSLSVLISAYFE